MDRSFVNVMDFGAVGDGVHDDTAALNAAIVEAHRLGLPIGSSVPLTILGPVVGVARHDPNPMPRFRLWRWWPR